MKIDRLKISLDERTVVDLAFEIDNSLALVGQSGSGKSLTLKALLGMLPSGMKKQLEYDASFVLKAGLTISFVPQNPFTALSPLTKITKQFFVTDAKKAELFKQVGLNSELLDRYPPELSGGQLQRVVIAMALESDPKLILLDEPTTALDPDTKIKILDLLKELQKSMGFKILFVTHDISSAKNLCEDICVIKDGLVVENGKMLKILETPHAEYTKTLIEANFSNRDFRQ
jgi:peptide/nickel transport system ATP-binding protein